MTQNKHNPIPDIISLGVLAAVFIYLVSRTWNKWGNLIIDTPRELWLPAQLLQGKLLYKDIFYIYGPFAPYLAALAYAIFGVHITTAAGCGMLVTALTALCLYKISRLFLNEIESALVILTFLFVYAFGFYVFSGIFNFILAYSLASTLLTLFSSLALYLFLKYILTSRIIYLWLWAIAMSGGFLCRIDLAGLLWAGFALLGALLILKQGSFLKIAFFLAMPVFIALLVYYIFLAATGAFFEFRQGVFDYLRLALTDKSAVFGLQMSGLDNLGVNLTLAINSFILYFAVVLIFALSCRLLSFWSDDKNPEGEIILMVFLAFVVFIIAREYFATLLYRPVPFILAWTACLSFRRMMLGQDFEKNMLFLSVSLIPLLLSLRVALNATAYKYGFYLLPLGLIGYFLFFLRSVKNFLASHLKLNPQALSASLFSFFLLILIPSWDISLWMYNNKDLRVTSPQGNLFCWRSQQSIFFWQAVDYLAKNTPQESSVVVFPEGVSINFFTNRQMPLKYYSFLPQDIKIYGEDNLIVQLRQAKVDYIVIQSRDTMEYGYAGFGFDYAERILLFIKENYQQVRQFGAFPNASPTEMGVVIFKRKSSPA
jgi:hypothetical protein